MQGDAAMLQARVDDLVRPAPMMRDRAAGYGILWWFNRI